MVMEFVHGGELFSYLRKAGTLDNAGGRFYASEITLALEHLHSRGESNNRKQPVASLLFNLNRELLHYSQAFVLELS